MEAHRPPRKRRPLRRWLLAKYFLRLGDREVEAELEETPEGLRVNIDGDWLPVGLQQLGNTNRYVLTLNDRVIEVLLEEQAGSFNLQIGGQAFEVDTARGRRRQAAETAQFVDGKWSLRAPLTGVVTEIRVSVGQVVEQGELLVIVEAMKMLNELKARVP